MKIFYYCECCLNRLSYTKLQRINCQETFIFHFMICIVTLQPLLAFFFYFQSPNVSLHWDSGLVALRWSEGQLWLLTAILWQGGKGGQRRGKNLSENIYHKRFFLLPLMVITQQNKGSGNCIVHKQTF